MKIQNYAFQVSNINKQPFNGVTSLETPGLFAFDLDDTLALGNKEEIEEVLKITQKRNAMLVYATGRTKEEVEQLHQEMSEKGIDFPMPDFLVSGKNHSRIYEIYENKDGELVNIFGNKEIKSKAEGICLISETLDIPFEEILMAGNDVNDLPMTYLCALGANFICVGNSNLALKATAMELARKGHKAYMANQEGAKGILEGLGRLLNYPA